MPGRSRDLPFAVLLHRSRRRRRAARVPSAPHGKADARGSGLASVVLAAARNSCRRGLHSYKPLGRESTGGMRNNEKFAEALRFFIAGATQVLRSCHTSRTCSLVTSRIRVRVSLQPSGWPMRRCIDWPARQRPRRCARFAWRGVTRTCPDVSLSPSVDQVASSSACGIDRRS